MSLRQLMWLLISAALVTNCTKEEDGLSNVELAETITIATGWHARKVETNFLDPDIMQAAMDANDEAESGISDVVLKATIEEMSAEYARMDDCERDDTYFFYEDGTMEYVPGPLDCPEEDFDIEGFFAKGVRWFQDGDQLTIMTDENKDGVEESHTINVLTINSKLLVLEKTYPITKEEFGVSLDKDLRVKVTFKII